MPNHNKPQQTANHLYGSWYTLYIVDFFSSEKCLRFMQGLKEMTLGKLIDKFLGSMKSEPVHLSM